MHWSDNKEIWNASMNFSQNEGIQIPGDKQNPGSGLHDVGPNQPIEFSSVLLFFT